MKDRRLRMAWNSNSVFSYSGYGVEQRDLLYRFLADGWPVCQTAFFGLEGYPIELNGLKIYPKMMDQWGTDALFYHGNHFKAHVRFTMQDVWSLNRDLLRQMTWIPYCPIDKEPIPAGVLDALRYAYKIITFSQWGHDVLQRAGFTSTLILEGTDTNIFKPLDKMECRKKYGLPTDKFIWGQIGANKENPPRKAWQESLTAFKMFHDQHPESMYFYQSNQQIPGGFPLIQYAQYLGIGNCVSHLDDYIAQFGIQSEQMNELLNAFDVLLHPSMTEGFGLIVVESESAGTPVIINNACSMPELIKNGETSLMCESNRKFFGSDGGMWLMPDPISIYHKMEEIYKMDRVKMGQKAREWVVEKYNVDKIVKECWLPLFESLQLELLGPLPVLTPGQESSTIKPQEK